MPSLNLPQKSVETPSPQPRPTPVKIIKIFLISVFEVKILEHETEIFPRLFSINVIYSWKENDTRTLMIEYTVSY